ncbi:ATP-binding protein [Streptomyces sp. ISL-11]|uniref:ATP-binding protein n=1 Tax=Streptomyces sp. ISL-11 TaxID=2819174 RepID=UPI001BE959CB|nr:ATP-binding protein [Streptomyces sp. ISL-11]MBT2385728.1 ATP-binding protein [Streptomyces sp. ISL-11]
MKQGTIKTLGVAALGIAFAATAAGSASAAGTAGTFESIAGTTKTTMGGLPVQQAAKLAPAGGPLVSATDRAIQGGILEAPSKAADMALAPNLPAVPKLPADTKGNGGLLGGLPLGNLSIPGAGG